MSLLWLRIPGVASEKAGRHIVPATSLKACYAEVVKLRRLHYEASATFEEGF